MHPFQTNRAAFLKDLGLNPEAQGDKMVDLLDKRVNDVVLKTVLGNLSDEGFQAFKMAMSSDNPEEEIAKVTAQVPGLAQKVEERVLAEYDLIRAVMA